MREVQGVLFDMDGVLLDSEAVYDECWRREAHRLGLRDIDRVHRQCLGLGQADVVAMLKGAYGAQFDGAAFYAATDALCRAVEEEQGLVLKPGAAEILGYLQERGYMLALASSNERQTVERQLGRVGLRSFFTAMVCGDEVARAKPAPDIYAAASAAVGLEPRHCVAVEDSPNGVVSATAAGVRCVMVPDRVQPDAAVWQLAWRVCAGLDGLREFL